MHILDKLKAALILVLIDFMAKRFKSILSYMKLLAIDISIECNNLIAYVSLEIQ